MQILIADTMMPKRTRRRRAEGSACGWARIPGPVAQRLCDRRISVFDGATRADIVLSRGAVVQVDIGPYRGPALDCRIRWVLVAGHRAKGSSVRRMAENDDMRVRLAPVMETGLLLPRSIAVGTGWGPARIEATRWGAAPSKRAAANH